ncbi:MAG: LacI family transcriptional regulator [Firmicutes bacterium]|nr:LacI family transcriptional regulator [Bacillota bacterium]
MVQGRITIKDVAMKAGVSTATVSRVLNKSEKVHSRTRWRVERACAELGFSRDPIATALRTGRSNTVHLLIERFDGNFIPDILVGIEAKADAENYRVLVSKLDNAGRGIWEPGKQYIDGIIVISDAVHDLNLSEVAGQENLPLVCVYSYTQDIRYPCVLPDDYQGAYLAVQHLATRGCNDVGFISGPPDWPASEDRLRGYRQAVEDFGLREDPNLIEVGDWTVATGYEACLRLLERTSFDSIFAGNDSMAIGAIDALREHELRVPRDVAVIGFDNAALCRYVRPTLSSIAMPLKELGEVAMGTLLSLIDQRNNGQSSDTEHVLKLPCVLRKRDSTKVSEQLTIRDRKES